MPPDRLRRGWCLGGDTFRQELLESARTRITAHHPAATRRETTEDKARRRLNEELVRLGWTAAALAQRAKGDAHKVRIVRRLRTETAVTLTWIATHLHLGTGTHVANRLRQHKESEAATKQNEFKLV